MRISRLTLKLSPLSLQRYSTFLEDRRNKLSFQGNFSAIWKLHFSDVTSTLLVFQTVAVHLLESLPWVFEFVFSHQLAPICHSHGYNQTALHHWKPLFHLLLKVEAIGHQSAEFFHYRSLWWSRTDIHHQSFALLACLPSNCYQLSNRCS